MLLQIRHSRTSKQQQITITKSWRGRQSNQSFYFALYWAKALAKQKQDPEIAKYFEPISKSLTENEDGIIKEIMELQGHEADLGGYYHTDPVKVQKIMRPSKILNQIIS